MKSTLSDWALLEQQAIHPPAKTRNTQTDGRTPLIKAHPLLLLFTENYGLCVRPTLFNLHFSGLKSSSVDYNHISTSFCSFCTKKEIGKFQSFLAMGCNNLWPKTGSDIKRIFLGSSVRLGLGVLRPQIGIGRQWLERVDESISLPGYGGWGILRICLIQRIYKSLVKKCYEKPVS